jgi:hypothetical protein
MLDVLKKVQGVITQVLEATGIAVTIAELAIGSGNGPAKKAEAVAKLKELVPVSIFPVLLQPAYDLILNLAVDVTVSFFNRSGFFTKSSEG